jgi:hypothetical protein
MCRKVLIVFAVVVASLLASRGIAQQVYVGVQSSAYRAQRPAVQVGVAFPVVRTVIRDTRNFLRVHIGLPSLDVMVGRHTQAPAYASYGSRCSSGNCGR